MIRTVRQLSALVFLTLCLAPRPSSAQTPVQGVVTQQGSPQSTQQGSQQASQQASETTQKATLGDDSLRPNYVLGGGDQLMLHALDMEEIGDRPMVIDGDGNINVPRLGIVKAAGLSISQLEAALVTLMRKYVREPQVTVTITQYRSEPVFFEGSFLKPGVYTLQGRRTLIEMITSVGGLSPNASRFISVTRRKDVGTISLPNAVTSTDGQKISVKISMASLRNDINPAENILLEPYDIVRAERAEPIYVDGAIAHVGGIDLVERDSLTITELITLAGGLKPEADGTKVRVLRPVMDTTKRSEISLNVDRILSGKDSDFPILPNDFLYFPEKPILKRGIGKGLLVALPIALTVVYLATRF
jgi:polysaccharide biosynthesis/export protein